MNAPRFEPSEAGFAELERGAVAGVSAIAHAIAERAGELAPVDTGEYRDSIAVEVDAGGARVVVASGHAAFVEFGTADTPAFAPVLRAQDAVSRDAPRIAAEAMS